MSDKEAVYKTKLAAEVFEVGLQFQDMTHCMQHKLGRDSFFALDCFRKAMLLDPNQKHINRYVALETRMLHPEYFNDPEDYLPNGPMIKPRYKKEFEKTCNARLADIDKWIAEKAEFKTCPSKKDTLE